MKQLTILLAACCMLLTTSCANITESQNVALIKIGGILERAGLRRLARENPNLVPYFGLAKAIIDKAMAEGTFEPTEVLDRLEALKELGGLSASDRADLTDGIDAVLQLYSVLLDSAVADATTRNIYLKTALEELSKALGAAVDQGSP